MLNYKRYKRVPVLDFPERTWPDKEIEKAPIWCSVDLRDGNQALVEPMVVEEKVEMFEMLVELGFKEIEVGFPASSQIEFNFLRQLVDRRLIPDDVKIQVLIQCREALIDRTFESIQGIKNVVVHIYNSTSTLQRDVVFGMSKDEVKQIAVDGTRMVRERAKDFEGNITLEYSPESFTGTEVDYALEVCEAVLDEWGASKDDPVIINLPATVEMTTPNVYADQIEWMSSHFTDRERVILSVHPHNDRGTGVAATELAMIAGADRVEGTLFGNGERTGNVDILTIAYNMFSQGIDPGLAIEDINKIIDVYERCTKMTIDPRHPYAGKLVFTAFSGSHQDAINKGVKAMKERGNEYWEVPYLPIDPSDIGRVYEPIVRINSQSGKGGVAFVMETFYGFKLPKGMHREFADVVQKVAESSGEVAPEQIMELFKQEYLSAKEPFNFIRCDSEELTETETKVRLKFRYNGRIYTAIGQGNGPIDAARAAMHQTAHVDVRVLYYSEHALGEGSHAQAASYIKLMDEESRRVTWGVGVSPNITRASHRALFSGLNRLFGDK